MKKLFVTAMLVVASVAGVYAQDAKQRAEAIASEFSKEKTKEKEKNGVVTKTQRSIEAKADFRTDPASYAGKYEFDGSGHYIVLRRLPNNDWEGDYIQLQDSKEVKEATLKNIKVESALLTATIQYTDGKALPLEGVFINRFENGDRTGGLGIKEVQDLSNGLLIEKAFYRRVE